jgi:hypothetical protein
MNKIDFEPEQYEVGIVAQETAEIEQEITDFFANNGNESIPWQVGPELLRTESGAFIDAMVDSGVVADHYSYEYRGLRLNETALRDLNRHPFMRTFSIVDVAILLDASHAMIKEAALDLDLEPVFIGRTFKQNEIGWDRFNKDQIILLSAAVNKFNAPTQYIAESKLIAATRISPLLIRKICEESGIERQWYRHQSEGQSDVFFSPEQAGQIISYVRDKRSKAQ